jgi:thioredoxin reductase/CRP-like cAMP-binding protein/Fe-S-cluster-containing hydrogenase component 2
MPESRPPDAALDVVIVGAGPAGLSAAAHAQANGMRYALLERSASLANTIQCYQKGKHVMAEPSTVPLRSDIPFAAGSREAVLGAWQKYVERESIALRCGQDMLGLTGRDGAFSIKTQSGELAARKVVLALGTQGNPRRLNAPGEDLPIVSTRLVDPGDFDRKTVVVVGAGDSAIEIALALCDRNEVYLVVRGGEIARAKESLTREIVKRQAKGQVQILYNTQVKRVLPGGVDLVSPDREVNVKTDAIIVKIGAQAPRKFLEELGVKFSSPDAEAKPVLTAALETTVPGLFLIGALTGRDLIKFGMNQGYEVIEHLLGRKVEAADEEVLRGRLPFWNGTVRERIQQMADELPLIGAALASGGAAGLSLEQLREVLLTTEPKTFTAGQIIERQDDYRDSVLLDVWGEAEIWRRDDRGRDRRVSMLTAGEFFGEMSLISGRRRSSTLISVGETRFLEIPRKAMLSLVSAAERVKRMVDQNFLLRALQTYLFPRIAAKDLWWLIARSRPISASKDELILEQGSPPEGCYLIRSGQVQVSRKSGDREIVLTYLVAGDVFGDGALRTDDGASPVTVRAIFPTELILLPKADFLAFLGGFPRMQEAFERRQEENRLEYLKMESTPGAGRALSELIREEIVIGTDALIIDEYKCTRCENCVRACEGVHDDGKARLSLTGVKFANLLAPNSCWQCENPLCMLDCPPDALYRDRSGEIRIRDNCIGCGNCESNCPYGNIFMVEAHEEFSLFGWVKSLLRLGADSSSKRSVAVKCDLCADLAGGPACVRSCPTGAAIRMKPEDYQRKVEALLTPGSEG